MGKRRVSRRPFSVCTLRLVSNHTETSIKRTLKALPPRKGGTISFSARRAYSIKQKRTWVYLPLLSFGINSQKTAEQQSQLYKMLLFMSTKCPLNLNIYIYRSIYTSYIHMIYKLYIYDILLLFRKHYILYDFR